MNCLYRAMLNSSRAPKQKSTAYIGGWTNSSRTPMQKTYPVTVVCLHVGNCHHAGAPGMHRIDCICAPLGCGKLFRKLFYS